MRISKFIARAALATAVVVGAALVPLASSAKASTIMDVFSFTDVSNNVLASGSFSYDSSQSGVLGYGSLLSFSMNFPVPNAQTYNLAFVNALNPSTNAVYFSYDTSSNEFVPGYASNGYGTTLAAQVLAPCSVCGFFVDAFPFQANVNNNDGILEGYSPDTGWLFATNYSISQTPLPAALPLFATGLGGLGLLGWRRRRQIAVALAA